MYAVHGVFILIPKIFFFQAEDGMRGYKVTGVQTCVFPIEEDGIRDYKVTGVQTCTLPIYSVGRLSQVPPGSVLLPPSRPAAVSPPSSHHLITRPRPAARSGRPGSGGHGRRPRAPDRARPPSARAPAWRAAAPG